MQVALNVHVSIFNIVVLSECMPSKKAWHATNDYYVPCCHVHLFSHTHIMYIICMRSVVRLIAT